MKIETELWQPALKIFASPGALIRAGEDDILVGEHTRTGVIEGRIDGCAASHASLNEGWINAGVREGGDRRDVDRNTVSERQKTFALGIWTSWLTCGNYTAHRIWPVDASQFCLFIPSDTRTIILRVNARHLKMTADQKRN